MIRLARHAAAASRTSLSGVESIGRHQTLASSQRHRTVDVIRLHKKPLSLFPLSPAAAAAVAASQDRIASLKDVASFHSQLDQSL